MDKIESSFHFIRDKINPCKVTYSYGWILGVDSHGASSHLLANSGLSPASAPCQARPRSSHCLGSSTPKNRIQEHTADGLETQSTWDIDEATRWNTFTILATFEFRLPDRKAKSDNLLIPNH